MPTNRVCWTKQTKDYSGLLRKEIDSHTNRRLLASRQELFERGSGHVCNDRDLIVIEGNCGVFVKLNFGSALADTLGDGEQGIKPADSFFSRRRGIRLQRDVESGFCIVMQDVDARTI